MFTPHRSFIFFVSYRPPAQACLLLHAAQLDALCSDPSGKKKAKLKVLSWMVMCSLRVLSDVECVAEQDIEHYVNSLTKLYL